MTIEKTKFEFFRRAGLPGNGHLIQLSPFLPVYARRGKVLFQLDLQVVFFENSYFDD